MTENDPMYLIVGYDWNAHLLKNCRRDVFRQAIENGKRTVRVTHIPTGHSGESGAHVSERMATIEALLALRMIDAVRAHEGIPDDANPNQFETTR